MSNKNSSLKNKHRFINIISNPTQTFVLKPTLYSDPPLNVPSSIYATLSPLPFPPKIISHTSNQFSFSLSELKEIQTPANTKPTKLIGDVQQQGQYMMIIQRINLRSQSSQDDYSSSHQERSNQENYSNSSYQSGSKNDEQKQQSKRQLLKGSQKDNLDQKQSNIQSKRKISFENTPSKKISCNCRKTKCLKLYCDCFRLGRTCQGCNCVGCHNLVEFEQERSNAIITLMERNPDPFGQKIEEDSHAKGCNCKKSNCLKKYCECYQAGLKCGEKCKCQQCKNLTIDKNFKTAKKERKMLEI